MLRLFMFVSVLKNTKEKKATLKNEAELQIESRLF